MNTYRSTVADGIDRVAECKASVVFLDFLEQRCKLVHELVCLVYLWSARL